MVTFDTGYRRVLLTGAAGFIGFHLAKKLLENNLEVIGYDSVNDYYDTRLKETRLAILAKFKSFVFIHDDLIDFDSLQQVFENYKPDIVINLAAQAGVRYSIDHPRAYIDSNIIGFFNILECCRHYPVSHLIFASSSSVYGNQQKVPFSTDDPVDRPISLYAAKKKSDELMAYTYSHLYDIPATGLRFFTVYGPYGRPDMAYFKFANLIRAGKPIKIYNNGDMRRDFTYVDDIIEGIARLINHAPKEQQGARYHIYNIGNNHPVRLMDFIETLEHALGAVAEKEYLPMQPGDVYQTFADISELEHDVGFRPQTSIKIGLQCFADWYRDYYDWH